MKKVKLEYLNMNYEVIKSFVVTDFSYLSDNKISYISNGIEYVEILNTINLRVINVK